MAERKQRRLSAEEIHKLIFEDDGDDASADDLSSTDDNDSDGESDAVSMHQDVDDSHGDNDGDSVSNEGGELLSDSDSDTLYMLNDDMLEDDEPSRIEDEDEECVADEENMLTSMVSTEITGESADDEDLNDFFYLARKGSDVWLKTPASQSGRFASQNVMKQAPGPTAYAVRRANSADELLKSFLTKPILEVILKMSNKEGMKNFEGSWEQITMVELEAFFGLLYLAGVFRSSGEATEELWHKEDGRKIFRAVMSRKRFKIISQVLRFDDKETRSLRRSKDRLAPIRDVWDAWVPTLSKNFIPYENVTVDEQLIPFRGRCSFRQFMKSKPAKYGIKVWALCDATTSYALNLQVYTGKIGNQPEKNQGERVVHDLIEVIDGSGRNVTTDNFFTSVPLARQLLLRKLSLVGTIRKNKPEIPFEFLASNNRSVHSAVFGHQQNLTLVSYVPKKNKSVLLLSSLHRDAEISNRIDAKPEIIMFYNQTKAGVDTMDQMVSTYSTKRMTRRYVRLFMFI